MKVRCLAVLACVFGFSCSTTSSVTDVSGGECEATECAATCVLQGRSGGACESGQCVCETGDALIHDDSVPKDTHGGTDLSEDGVGPMDTLEVSDSTEQPEDAVETDGQEDTMMPDQDGPKPCTAGNVGMICQAGQGCVEGFCGVCTKGEECALGLGCSEGTCGACTDGGQCPASQGCKNQMCGPCTKPDQCAGAQGCLNGVCAPCESKDACSGGLCEAGECIPCTIDADCKGQYDSKHVCDAGICVVPACTSDADCGLKGELCSLADFMCIPCTATVQCLESSAYGGGHLCLDGKCSEGNCLSDADCTPDKPICGQDHACRGCLGASGGLHLECIGKLGEGWLCTQGGTCVEGNCLSTIDCQSTGQICAQPAQAPAETSPYVCRACAFNAECQTGYDSGFLCITGTCVSAVCNEESPCADGLVCDQQLHVCRDCVSSIECGAGQVCDLVADGGSGQCYQGVCTPVTQTSVCSTGLCVGFSCVPCGPSLSCGPGRVCFEGNCLWGSCAVDSDCSGMAPLACHRRACLGDSDGVRSCQYQALPVDMGCDDGNPCTLIDVCTQQGTCVGAVPLCDDGITCTENLCNPNYPTEHCSYPLKANSCWLDGGCQAVAATRLPKPFQCSAFKATSACLPHLGAGECMDNQGARCFDDRILTNPPVCDPLLCQAAGGSCLTPQVCFIPASTGVECAPMSMFSCAAAFGGSFMELNFRCDQGSLWCSPIHFCEDAEVDGFCRLAGFGSGSCTGLHEGTCAPGEPTDRSCNYCDPSVDQLLWQQDHLACDDDVWCTLDLCTLDGCSHPVSQGNCRIEGLCYADTERREPYSCEVCRPVTPESQESWSLAPDGADCDSKQTVCVVEAKCDASGMCIKTPSPDLMTCEEDGDPCTQDYCMGGECLHDPSSAWCWQDPETGLRWQRVVGAQKGDVEFAESQCGSLNLGGGAWRLPTFDELKTLDYGCGKIGDCLLGEECSHLGSPCLDNCSSCTPSSCYLDPNIFFPACDGTTRLVSSTIGLATDGKPRILALWPATAWYQDYPLDTAIFNVVCVSSAP